MEDALSHVSGKSNTTNRNRFKICAYDGKREGPAWSRHYDNHHVGLEKKEWVPDEPLSGKQWCDNWKEFITNPKAIAINPLPQFQRGAGKQFSQKGSVNGSRGGAALSQYLGDDDVEMQHIIEEEKKEVAVPAFGDLGTNANSGNRLPPTTTNGL